MSKVRVKDWPFAGTVTLASFADATVELLVTSGTLFSPVVNETTSLSASSRSALVPASEAS